MISMKKNSLYLDKIPPALLVKPLENISDSQIPFVNICFQQGRCYQFGLGVPEDKKKAEEWYKKAGRNFKSKGYHISNEIEENADKGDRLSQCIMGIYYLGPKFGPGNEINLAKAHTFLNKAAINGCVTAYYYLGYLHEVGCKGVPQSKEEAKHCYRLAGKEPLAERRLVELFKEEDKERRKKEKEFILLLQQAQDGNMDAQRLLGSSYWKGQIPNGYDVEEALYWLEQAANKGNDSAQFLLGEIYQSNCNPKHPQNAVVAIENVVQALTWYFRAADQGNLEALYRLAEIQKLYGFDDLHVAAAVGDRYRIHQLFKRGFGVLLETKEGYTAQQLAKMGNHFSCAKDLKTFQNNPTLSQLFSERVDECCKLLLEKIKNHSLEEVDFSLLFAEMLADEKLKPLQLVGDNILVVLQVLETNLDIVKRIKLDNLILGFDCYASIKHIVKYSSSLEQLSVLQTGLKNNQIDELHTLARIKKYPPIIITDSSFSQPFSFFEHRSSSANFNENLLEGIKLEDIKKEEPQISCEFLPAVFKKKVSKQDSMEDIFFSEQLTTSFIQSLKQEELLSEKESLTVQDYVHHQKDEFSKLTDAIAELKTQIIGQEEKIAQWEKRLGIVVKESSGFNERLAVLEEVSRQLQEKVFREKQFFEWCNNTHYPQGQLLYVYITKMLTTLFDSSELTQGKIVEVRTGGVGAAANFIAEGIGVASGLVGVGLTIASILCTPATAGLSAAGALVGAGGLVLGVGAAVLLTKFADWYTLERYKHVSDFFRHGPHRLEVAQEVGYRLAYCFEPQLRLLENKDIEKVAAVAVARLFERLLAGKARWSAKEFPFTQPLIDPKPLVDFLVLEICTGHISKIRALFDPERKISDLLKGTIKTTDGRRWILQHIFTSPGLELHVGEMVHYYSKPSVSYKTRINEKTSYLYRFPVSWEEQSDLGQFGWVLVGGTIQSKHDKQSGKNRQANTPFVLKNSRAQLFEHRQDDNIKELKKLLSKQEERLTKLEADYEGLISRAVQVIDELKQSSKVKNLSPSSVDSSYKAGSGTLFSRSNSENSFDEFVITERPSTGEGNLNEEELNGKNKSTFESFH